MFRRYSPFMYIVGVFMVIGLLTSVIKNPSGLALPVIIFAVVFYLWKFPPKRFRGGGFTSGPSPRMKQQPKSKTAKFRVIPGSKTDDEEPPKYH
ncbi:hypothetical protein [Paenibacillus sp. y28]|uniref:hypothetical protein n=1 Tax=Paenibacillus sp. y28 TaxID=3129110 RepID=UPI00301A0223